MLPFFFINFTFGKSAEHVLTDVSFSKAESIEKIFFKAVDVNKHVKQNKRKQRKLFKKWSKANRKKLGLGAGLLSMFSLLAWRRRLKKRKKKARRASDHDNDGCAKVGGIMIVTGLIALLGKWLINALFGVMVNFWVGALLGFAAIGLIVLIMWLIAKARNGEF